MDNASVSLFRNTFGNQSISNLSGTSDDHSGALNISTGKLVLEILMILMGLGAVAGNILVIIIVAATKNFHSVTSVLIINLAVSDCLVGIGVMPFVAMTVMYDGWVQYTNLCLYVGYTSSLYCTASVLTLAAIALDRYHAIIDCLHYSSQSTVWRTAAAVIWIWLQAAITSFPPLLGWSNVRYIPQMYSCSVEWSNSPSYTGFMAAFSFLFPACVMMFCYIKIVRVARSHARRIHDMENHLQKIEPHTSEMENPSFSQLIYYVNLKLLPEYYLDDASSISDQSCHLHTLSPAKKHSFSRHNAHSREHHGVFRLFLVISAFFCCWMPYITVALVQAIEAATARKPTQIPPNIITFVYWLALFNSVINPLLYALLSKRFRKALRNLHEKLLARVTGHAGEHVGSDLPISMPTRQRTGSSITTVSRDRCGSTSVFSIDSFTPSGGREHFHDYLPGNITNPSYPSTPERGNSKELSGYPGQLLEVPKISMENDRLIVKASACESQSTFVFGPITIKVEEES
ncbi:5-hydroxytryptamine receptor [Polypterus senegalus]|nr:5-hydroxytryptamine receptor [Polypterus senegalus]